MLTRCEDAVNILIGKGAIIVSEKKEQSGSLLGKTITLQKDNCKFKFGYLNFGGKQIVVEKLCQCNNKNWSLIPINCNLI